MREQAEPARSDLHVDSESGFLQTRNTKSKMWAFPAPVNDSHRVPAPANNFFLAPAPENDFLLVPAPANDFFQSPALKNTRLWVPVYLASHSFHEVVAFMRALFWLV